MNLIAYRHAAYDTPWWVNPNSRAGRFNAVDSDPTQYLCLHPMGPAAEWLRSVWGRERAAAIAGAHLSLWAAVVDDTDVVTVDFTNCEAFGIDPDELIGDDYAPTQALAERLRGGGSAGLRVPSAALPGTENLVLFGPRLVHPYLFRAMIAEEVPTGHLSGAASPPSEVLAYVRWRGTPHVGLDLWHKRGESFVFLDPIASS
jgi:RES domain-containing protein